uniref:Aminotransferase-like plant mobile domain-containing protein n=1 Tax=Cajanus cajan TaxID=3821 RepID=A0A151U7S8_CAJCA|nr:hypothetical protein KK1_008103 [Cajanus cajan]
MEEASLKIFNSQVLLPFSLQDGATHAFLDPFISQNKKKFGNTLLSEDSSTLPFIYSPTIDLNLFSDTTKIFRAFPLTKDRHLLWLERVEKSMHSACVEAGISEFIQLSKFDLHAFDPQMLLSAIFFWNRETRAFEFPCGFVCPTAGTPVSTSEHIAFLMYWLSACVFCTPSLQVPKYYYILAQALHLQKKICLSKLLLASLYSSLDEASESLFHEFGPHNLSGPLWLLQLWLNAILEKKLPLTSSFSPICPLEGARLTTLTPRKRSIENFAKYVRAFLSFTDFTEDLASFIHSTLTGPAWLQENNQVGNISPDFIEMWFGFLSWDVILSGMRQKDVRIYPYQP